MAGFSRAVAAGSSPMSRRTALRLGGGVALLLAAGCAAGTKGGEQPQPSGAGPSGTSCTGRRPGPAASTTARTPTSTVT